MNANKNNPFLNYIRVIRVIRGQKFFSASSVVTNLNHQTLVAPELREGGSNVSKTDCLPFGSPYSIVVVTFKVEIERETDGRWIAEIPQIPGAMAYGSSREEAVARVEALGLRVLAERIEHGESSPKIEKVFAVATA
jgi:predicted RNase H-like HicB family nuclease